MSQQPLNKDQQYQGHLQNQQQGQYYQGQPQGQQLQASSQLGTNASQQGQTGQQGQTYQGQQNQWQQSQTNQPQQNQNQPTTWQQGQQNQWQQPSTQQAPQSQLPQGQQAQNTQWQQGQQTVNQNNPWQQGHQNQSQLPQTQQTQQNQPLQGQQNQSSVGQNTLNQTNTWQQGQSNQWQQYQSQTQQTQPSQGQQSQSNPWQGQQAPSQTSQIQGQQGQTSQSITGQQTQSNLWQQGQQNQSQTSQIQQNQSQGQQNQSNPWQGQQNQNNQLNQAGQTYQAASNQQGQQAQQPQKPQQPSQQQLQGQPNQPNQSNLTQQLQNNQGQNFQWLQGQQGQQGQQPQGLQPQNNQFQGNQQPNLQSGVQQQGQSTQLPTQPSQQSNPSSPQKKSNKKDKEKEKEKEKEKQKEKQKEKKKGTTESPKKEGDGKKKTQKLEPAPQAPFVEEVIPANMNSNEIIAYMKKNPYSQKIGNVEYTYSLLSKKQESFVLSHDRFLYLKGYESISYAREFDAKKTLPFTEDSQIPKAKATFPLDQIEKYVNDQEKLIIQFKGAKKVKWEFVCLTKGCALKWKKKIEATKLTYEDWVKSGIPNIYDYLKMKQNTTLQQNINQQNNTNQLFSQNNPYQQQQQFQSPNKSQLNFNSTNQGNYQSNLNPQNQQNPQGNIYQSNFNPQSQQNTQGSTFQQNPNRPTSVLYQGPQAAKINNFIEGNSPQPRPYLNQSMSRIPFEGKEDIKNDIRKIKRNWIEELLGGEEQVELVIEFKNYVQRVAEVIVNELYVPQESKMYPAHEFAKDYASYLLDDIYIEIYLNVEDNPSIKNQRYKNAVNEFKNFEYLLSATKNEGILKVPFMTLFEYKGFLGMAKSKVGDGRGFKNKQFYEIINRRQFEEITRISADTLLNESKCKIVSIDWKNNGPKLTNQYSKVYFVERLADFLPFSDKEFGPTQDKILRRQLVSDEEFEDQVFKDRVRQVKNDKINSIIDRKISELVSVLELEETYFTNSQELTELIHLYGLNIHYLGTIFKKTKLSWLKRIFQAEIAARCLKNVFRMDIQTSILQSYNQNNQERQEDREKNRVVSFLNVIFGNTEPTFRLWRNINTYAVDKYHTKIWDHQFTDVNTGYLLQAIQTHFKITLTENVSERKFFKSMSSFGPRDFVRFNFDATIYNLDFTNTFELIHESFEEENIESFQTIGQILTKETSTHIPYLELLKNHPIHDKISQFFLNFISPEDNSELYNKIESKYLPHKFLYESKFAQIKWYLKANKSDRISKAASYIEDHARRWLGDTHPLFTQLNRMLAEYFSENQIYYSKALKYAQVSLDMQRALFEGDGEPLWRDYYLIGKIHYINNHIEEALTYLTKAKNLVKVENLREFEVYGELCLMLSKGYFGAKYYKESYSTVRELYKTIRQDRDERSLVYIVEAVSLIKQLLQINQEHESYYKFVESDFSSIVYAFADYPALMNQSIKMITIPYLKNVILRNSKNKVRLLNIIEEISKIKQSANSCNAYIKAKISEGTFPKSYLHCLKEIDSVIDEILANQMIERWKSFNNLANQSILDKIGNSQINRGFDFLANMTALFNLLGQEVLEELFIMEK